MKLIEPFIRAIQQASDGFRAFLDQGGLVLWLMLLLSVLLYTVLASSWCGLWSVKRQITLLKGNLTFFDDQKLLQDEVELFELDRLAWVQRRLPVLSVLIALAPLSGLLGTVAGMLQTFAGMASQSTAKPIDSISSGISQALITTQIGLLITIPAALLFTLLKSQFAHAQDQLEQVATQRSVALSLDQLAS